ncbi:succinate dehydrogenase cytochrome b subunit [Anaeromyxobacter oryzae]|uniref:succinate dehydrogenase cytochrome b subunit n=1 Tax=Anaeromyxobacter oryzae TaxID=2918170 RepID=UPI0020BFA0DC|nr:succinate dehydrogenase cytochrome b subunit [Anaeromyxobacter oryzae]
MRPGRVSRAGALWRSVIGKKALMAVTGAILFLYVFFHLLGNLQIFTGPEQINRYAALLRVSPQLLWTARVILLVAVCVHAVAGAQLFLLAREARPVAYQDFRPIVSSTASRTMIWSGLLILAFVVYHVLDLTVGVVNPSFQEGDVYHNVLATFGRAVGVIAYVVAMVALGFHLWHGLWSMFQSLGFANRRAAPTIQRFAVTMAVILTLGFSAIPMAVLVGILRP